MQSAISLYQYYAGKRGIQALISVEDVVKNSDCGRLNLMCPVCFDRVHLVNRNKRGKNERYFAHWPNPENQDCEQKFINSSQSEREKQIINGINKEKADYEKHFWLIIQSCFPIIYRTEKYVEAILKDETINNMFEKTFYPIFGNCKEIIQFLCTIILDNSIEKDWHSYEHLNQHDRRLVERILKQNSKIYRHKASLLLSEFLLQKRSYFIVKKLWALSIALWIAENPKNKPLPPIAKFIPYCLNNIVSLLVWVPWDSVLHDIKVFGKIQSRNKWSNNFDLITIVNLPDLPDEINKISRLNGKPGKTNRTYRR